MTKHVISKLVKGCTYNVFFEPEEYKNPQHNDHRRPIPLPVVKKKIHIRQGAGLPSLTSGFGEMTRTEDGIPIWTPDGMTTPISDSDFELLKENHVFKQHLQQGLIKVIGRDVTGNHRALQKEVATLDGEDNNALMTAERFAKKEKKAAEALKLQKHY